MEWHGNKTSSGRSRRIWLVSTLWISTRLLILEGAASCGTSHTPDDSRYHSQPPPAQGKLVTGKARLAVAARRALPIKGGPGLAAVNSIIATDDGYIMADAQIANAVYQYTFTDSSLRIVGTRGTATGEYLAPYWPALARDDRTGDVLIYDGSSGRLMVYDISGRFVAELNSDHRFSIVAKMHFDGNGDLLELANDDGIAVLRKFRRHDLLLLYAKPLTTRALDALVWHIPRVSGYCYSQSRQRIYYVAPADYRVQVIDAQQGEQIEVFGAPPTGYRELPPKYRELGILKTPEQLQPVLESISLLDGGMYLLQDKWLLLGYTGADADQQWLVYDVDSPLQPLTVSLPPGQALAMGPKCSNGTTLDVYTAPSDVLDRLTIGTITQYRLEAE